MTKKVEEIRVHFVETEVKYNQSNAGQKLPTRYLTRNTHWISAHYLKLNIYKRNCTMFDILPFAWPDKTVLIQLTFGY